jgi:hypothetical protein
MHVGNLGDNLFCFLIWPPPDPSRNRHTLILIHSFACIYGTNHLPKEKENHSLIKFFSITAVTNYILWFVMYYFLFFIFKKNPSYSID